MPKYYAYAGQVELGQERPGSQGRHLFDAASDAKASAIAEKRLGGPFRLYRYTSFYDDRTFVEVKGK